MNLRNGTGVGIHSYLNNSVNSLAKFSVSGGFSYFYGVYSSRYSYKSEYGFRENYASYSWNSLYSLTSLQRER